MNLKLIGLRDMLINYILCFLVFLWVSPVEAQELSSKDREIVERYNQSIEEGRAYSRRYNDYEVAGLPVCEFATWYSESPNQPRCAIFWTGWCWADKQPSIRVYDKPDGKVINALKAGRLLSPEDFAGEKIKVYYDYSGEWGEESSWIKVFGPYKNQYRYWGWVKNEDIDCEP